MSIYKMVFSPTGGTERAADQVARAFAKEAVTIDLTDAGADFGRIQLTPQDICVAAVPSFGGRVPGIAAARMREIRGNGAQAVLLTAYGNRAYDDTLLEMKEILTGAGFRCVAAIAAVAEHSIMHQFAKDRPDREDLEELLRFGKQVRRCMEEEQIREELTLPGTVPYRKYEGIPIRPAASRKCTRCGLCAQRCPVRAIPKDHPDRTNKKNCISCMRCLAECPVQARRINGLLAAIAGKKMKKSCSGRKRNELFLGGQDHRKDLTVHSGSADGRQAPV